MAREPHDDLGLSRLAGVGGSTPDDKFFGRLIAAMDMFLADAIRNGEDLRAIGFTETADALGM